MSNALKHRAGKGLLWRLAFYGSLAGLILYAQPAARCFFDPLREDSLLQPCLTTSSMVLLPEKQRASALFQVAQSHASSGLPTEAIATAEHAVALDPSLRGGREFLAEIFYRAGNAALDLKSFSAAIENYTKALEHDPSHRRARMRRGFAFSEAGQLASAITDFTEVLKVDSTDASAFDYRAGAYLKLGRHAEAIRDLSASIAITPGNKWALASRASARAEIKDYHGALTDADAALGLMPEDEASHSAKIAALSGLKKFDEALSAVDTWEQVAGKKTARTESKRAQILATKGYARSAVEALDRAILLDPDYAWAYSYRGFLKWQDFNNATAALEDFEIAIALGDASARRYKQRILDSRRR